MSNELLAQQDGPIFRITINRPEAGNGMTDPMVVELAGLIEACEHLGLLLWPDAENA